jgi:uncharacterized protein with HEPN domain
MNESSSEEARGVARVGNMLDAISNLRQLLANRAIGDVVRDRHILAAAERYIEIISEASRHVPEDWKSDHGPTILWRQIAAIGNILRHVYQHVDPNEVWNVYEHDLDPLQLALESMIAAHGEASS